MQFPDVPVPVKRAFWNKIEQLFGGMLVDHSHTFVNSTSINDMLARGERVVIYAADYAEVCRVSYRMFFFFALC